MIMIPVPASSIREATPEETPSYWQWHFVFSKLNNLVDSSPVRLMVLVIILIN